MREKNPFEDAPGSTRREFVKTTAVALGAAALPFKGFAAIAPSTARYRRFNVLDPRAKPMLDSYRKAIRAMLALPPDDPRNWYRIALIHTLDCPHGNWWFLVWHRGFLGWFERIVREMSGDPNFAMPYWDWSANPDPGKPFHPGIPDMLFDDILTPANPEFIATYMDFYKQYEPVVAKAGYWNRGTDFDPSGPYGQLLARSVRFPADLWFDIHDDPRGLLFFELANARGLTREKPWFDGKTARAVALQTILDALSPRDFLTFASPKTMSHSGLTGFGVLEGQPHNRVHNCIGGIFTDPSGKTTDSGGFMQANLSPVDPIFFLHHANIDRLWDVWTRKQQARGYPILPDGYQTPRPSPAPPFTDYELWSSEPFVFFIDEKGQPVDKTTAGDYAAIGDFDYDYQPGSGEEVVTAFAAAPKGRLLAAPAPQRFSVGLTQHEATQAHPAVGSVAIPQATLEKTGRTGTLLAKITLALPPSAHGDFKVVVNAPGDPAKVDPSSPSFAGTLSMFGHHTMHCPVTFTVPLTTSVAALRSNKLLRANAPLNIQVVPEAPPQHQGMLMAAPKIVAAQAEVLSITVEAPE